MPEIINYAIRLPRDLKNRMKDDAEKRKISLNANLIKVYQQYLDGELIPVGEILEDPRSKELIKKVIQEAALESPVDNATFPSGIAGRKQEGESAPVSKKRA